MFDDLHDPDPPRPGMDTLANVSHRAQVLRRRRVLTSVGGGVAVVALATAAIWIPGRADDRQIRSVETTPSTETVPATVPATVASTVPDEPVLPDRSTPFAAIDGNGDAVLIGWPDRATPPQETMVLYDGADPDDDPPSEGEVTAVDGVAISPDGRTAIVGVCCEPIAGSLVQVDVGSRAQSSTIFGHLPSYGPAGDLASASVETIDVRSPRGDLIQTFELDPSRGTVVDLAVIDSPAGAGGQILWIEVGPGGATLWQRFFLGGDVVLSTTLSTATGADADEFSLAGYSGAGPEGVFMVLNKTTHELLSFDAVTLAPIGVDDSGVDAISEWIVGDSIAYVDADRRLFVNGVQVPGEYLWVR